MRYLLSITIATFLVVTLFFNDYNFFTGGDVSGRQYPESMYVTGIIVVFVVSFATMFLMQSGVNKSNGLIFFTGGLIAFMSSVVIIPAVFLSAWGTMLLWVEPVAIMGALLFVLVASQIFERGLQAGRNTYILLYLVGHSIMVLEGSAASVVLAMIMGTFIAVPVANLAHK